jgi:ADP-L-glycero-D-manno-heptose 6-epimerase
MASMVYQLYGQLRRTGKARLFEGSGGYAAGEQQRDFVSVKDVVRVNLHFAASPICKGIFNCGTGEARSFNQIATQLMQQLGKGEIEYIPFAPGLREKYQSFTQADLTALRGAGYTAGFSSLEEGIANAVKYWQAE